MADKNMILPQQFVKFDFCIFDYIEYFGITGQAIGSINAPPDIYLGPLGNNFLEQKPGKQPYLNLIRLKQGVVTELNKYLFKENAPIIYEKLHSIIQREFSILRDINGNTFYERDNRAKNEILNIIDAYTINNKNYLLNQELGFNNLTSEPPTKDGSGGAGGGGSGGGG